MGYSGQDPNERIFENDYGKSIPCKLSWGYCENCGDCERVENKTKQIKLC